MLSGEGEDYDQYPPEDGIDDQVDRQNFQMLMNGSNHFYK